MADPVAQIRAFNQGRDPELLQRKYDHMRSGAFVFLRATCHLYCQRVPYASVFRKAPAVWASGDLHLENFGSYKGDNRQVYFDINDFDEALRAPATWDVVRLLTSVLVARDTMHMTRRESLALCEVLIGAYARALEAGKARWVERETAPSPVRELLASLRHRRRPAYLDTRTVEKGKSRTIRIDGKKALVASPEARERVARAVAGFAATQDEPRFFEVLDVARRIAGKGSLGVERYIVLVRGKGSPDGNYLLDIKQALPPSAREAIPLAQPAWPDDARRVVAIQQRMQAIAMAFLHTIEMNGRSFILRGLQPSEDRVALEAAARDGTHIDNLMRVLGECLAWAQLRSSGREGSATADELIAYGARRKWRARSLELAQEAAESVEDDYAAFSAAYDDGVFRVTATPASARK